MDRITYDPTIDPATILDRSLAESARLIERWHGADDGRLRYAVTPRFAVSCTAELLRESAALAASTGAYWQTHVSEDRGEIAEVARLFPEALDYVDVYDRAGGLGRADRAGPRRAPVRPRAGAARRDRDAGRPLPGLEPVPRVGGDAARAVPGGGAGRRASGRTWPAGRTCRSSRVMRAGFYAQNARRVAGVETGPVLAPLDWLRLGSLGGARALGLGRRRSARSRSGKEADLIAVDPAYVAPLAGQSPTTTPRTSPRRLIFRAHPDMVRGAWVRGRRLEGPGERAA